MSKNLLSIWTQLKAADKKWEKMVDYTGTMTLEDGIMSVLKLGDREASQESLIFLDRKLLEKAFSHSKSEWGQHMYEAIKAINSHEEER